MTQFGLSDVTTEGTMISVNRALWMTSQTFCHWAPGCQGSDGWHRRWFATSQQGFHGYLISRVAPERYDITTGFSMVMIGFDL